MQQMIAPAGYFRDPNQMEAYLENSIFLRYLLNEVDHPLKERNKQRFVALNSFTTVEFVFDTVVYPQKSQIFGYVDKKNEVV